MLTGVDDARRRRAPPVPRVARRRLDRRPGRRARLGVLSRDETISLVVERRRVAASSGPNGCELDPPVLVPPVPATAPSTRNVGNECGVLTWNTLGGSSSGRIPARRAWTSSVASQVGRKRDGAGVFGSGSGAPRQVEQLLAVLGAEPPQLEPRQRRSSAATREPGPARDVLARTPGRSRRGSGATSSSIASPAVTARRSEPVLREGVQVGPPPLPRARRRRPHQVDPQPDAARAVRLADAARRSPRAAAPVARSARPQPSRRAGHRRRGVGASPASRGATARAARSR